MRYAEVTLNNNKVIAIANYNNQSDYNGANIVVRSDTAQINDTWIGGTNFILANPPPSINIPNWSGWASDMTANAAYTSFLNSFLGGVLATATNLRSLGRYDNYLDLLSTKGDDFRMYSAFIGRWNAIVLIPLINLPSNGNIIAWNTIAANNFMPFTFSSPSAQMVSI